MEQDTRGDREKLNESQLQIIDIKSAPTNINWNEIQDCSTSLFFFLPIHQLLNSLDTHITYSCYLPFHHIKTHKSVQLSLRFSLDDDLNYSQYHNLQQNHHAFWVRFFVCLFVLIIKGLYIDTKSQSLLQGYQCAPLKPSGMPKISLPQKCDLRSRCMIKDIFLITGSEQ